MKITGRQVTVILKTQDGEQKMNYSRKTRGGGFSLLELVIVVVIIGVISAIAIPRMTRGASNAGATALQANLAVLRNAIEIYRAEHQGAFPSAESFKQQLTMYTKADGTNWNVAPDTDTDRIYGPYIRAVPMLPVGARKSQVGVAAADGALIGWIYDEVTGVITGNTTSQEVDINGVRYDSY